MIMIPEVNEVYRHFKGNRYRVVAVAEHTESGEMLVVYQALYGDGKVYARPVAMFMEKIDRAKYPEANQTYRFELCEDEPVAELPVREAAVEEDSFAEEEAQIDPMLLAFMDADDYDAKLNILIGMHHRITNEMLTTMAIVCDVELEEGDLEERFDSLKSCLLTRQRYEGSRYR